MSEDQVESYRRAVIDVRPECVPAPQDLARLQACRGKLEALLSEEFDEFSELYRPLTEDRNRAWIPRLEDMLDDYNSTSNGSTEYPVVADPDLAAINRFAIVNR